MTKGALGVLLGGLLAVNAAAATTRAAAKTAGYVCSLTGKTVQECCCTQQKDGKLYCTLAKRTVDPCCCRAENSQRVIKK